ncbi:FxLD family lantipeptide [Amycolatopsis rhizosphaerae]|uniref:FxLD family lantipeptide n=1 Tax=Amycolatopsis rhizosphaerae TaxID=2053003 RepID=A0A558ANB5_9PSEU|nr:FxLD family lanthipeptide [Amycolatopsis rhizosphaerae]TVT25756.1 FxLD family lantipeptide [Amycolatopsis rhizosphaerae]
MSVTTFTKVQDEGTDDPFVLDLRIITDVPPDHPLAACKGNTDDGCDPTCASACVSGGI